MDRTTPVPVETQSMSADDLSPCKSPKRGKSTHVKTAEVDLRLIQTNKDVFNISFQKESAGPLSLSCTSVHAGHATMYNRI